MSSRSFKEDDVDAGEIITTLLVKADSKNIVSVASEQIAPTIAVTPWAITPSAAAIAAAEGVIAQGVTAIVGAICSEATETIFLESALTSRVVMISPASTSSSLNDLDDKGFFRISPSDSRGGQILADITKDRKVKSVAIT